MVGVEQIKRLGPVEQVRFAIECAEHAHQDLKSAAIAAARAWVECPCEQHGTEAKAAAQMAGQYPRWIASAAASAEFGTASAWWVAQAVDFAARAVAATGAPGPSRPRRLTIASRCARMPGEGPAAGPTGGNADA